jgi:hypothetical protein
MTMAILADLQQQGIITHKIIAVKFPSRLLLCPIILPNLFLSPSKPLSTVSVNSLPISNIPSSSEVPVRNSTILSLVPTAKSQSQNS